MHVELLLKKVFANYNKKMNLLKMQILQYSRM